jgi:hypothetical protein
MAEVKKEEKKEEKKGAEEEKVPLLDAGDAKGIPKTVFIVWSYRHGTRTTWRSL